MHWSFAQSDLDAINEEWYRAKVGERLHGTSHILRELIATTYAIGCNSREVYDMLCSRKPA